MLWWIDGKPDKQDDDSQHTHTHTIENVLTYWLLTIVRWKQLIIIKFINWMTNQLEFANVFTDQVIIWFYLQLNSEIDHNVRTHMLSLIDRHIPDDLAE